MVEIPKVDLAVQVGGMNGEPRYAGLCVPPRHVHDLDTACSNAHKLVQVLGHPVIVWVPWRGAIVAPEAVQHAALAALGGV